MEEANEARDRSAVIVIKNEKELERMRVAGRVTACICGEIARCVGPGVETGELDALARELISKAGGRSAFLGYRGYPGHVCISVNEEVVHGIPGRRRVEMGDIVSLDVGVEVDGFIGDTATTVGVGVTDPGRLRLISAGEEALRRGIEAARAGARLSDISHAIEQSALRRGFSVVRDFVGHGVGRKMHEEPQIPNFGPAGRGPKLAAGMTLAIEPMINGGSHEVRVLDDGWTVVTRDGAPSVHFEHTIAIAEGEAEMLTSAGSERKN